MAAITRLHPPSLLSSFKSSSSLIIRFPSSSTLYSPRRLRSLCSNAQAQVSTAEANGSIVGDLLDYLNESWTHFHATAEAKRQLIDAGFHLLNENDEWDLKPGGRYFFTRNMSCLVAFAVGEK
ncbi:PREDICTED: aspartyl aminopeptidase-like [Fragaria vesca subsp. vesca]|uniref:aspartyl aminopeptidase-like n=1 Tax=Fragaria vesca subsp. vesca TaxID=101020 RepID=UPI0002C31E4F|nr:PREDICTED: aspartyl aminopeptidase-like [Fragaria vesca subsp. vesca]